MKRYLNDKEIERLGKFKIIYKRIGSGTIGGIHKSKVAGFNVEFVEHRKYIPGDDPKTIDWKLYARKDKLYTKLYEEEVNIKIAILCDFTLSSIFSNREYYIKKLAMAIAYIGIKQGDIVKVSYYNGKDIEIESFYNKQIGALNKWLSKATPSKGEDINRLIKENLNIIYNANITFLISDLLTTDTTSIINNINKAKSTNGIFYILHILTKEELTFPFKGSFNFIDPENNKGIKTDATKIKKTYLQKIKSFIHKIEKEAKRQNIKYFLINTSVPLLDSIKNIAQGREEIEL